MFKELKSIHHKINADARYNFLTSMRGEPPPPGQLLQGAVRKLVQHEHEDGRIRTVDLVHTPRRPAERPEAAAHLSGVTRYAVMLAPVLVQGPQGFLGLDGVILNSQMGHRGYLFCFFLWRLGTR